MGCSSDKNSKTIENKKNFNTQNTFTSQNISQVLTQNNKNAENEEDILIYNDLLVSENKEEIIKYYVPLETIGEGAYGKVFKVRHRVTGKTYAIKMLKKKDIKILNEIKILRKLDHPNIMKVYEYFSSEYCWYFVEEYVAGGDLYEQICKLQYYNEVTASNIMKQIFSFVSYLHQMNIVHRDIKPKNMMVSNKKDEIEIKLVDFGTATFFSRKKPLTDRVGTPIYMAPEVLKGNYFNECDLWSCGVILYILLGGNPPFDGKNSQEIYSKIEKCDVKLKGNEWNNVSDEAKDLIIKLLEKNVSKRITAQEALKHPFITNNTIKKNQTFNKLSLKNCLQTFASKQKLHQASVAFIVHQMSNNKMIQKLTEIFKQLDESGEGLLSKDELKKGYKKFFNDKITDSEFDQIMKTIDQDNSGQISIEEFIRATVDYENLVSEKNLKSAFDFFDKDHSGSLSPDEVREVLGLNEDNNSTNKIVEGIIKDVDVNGDGLISYDEFKAMMKNNKSLLKNE